jgi:hypothetical protein
VSEAIRDHVRKILRAFAVEVEAEAAKIREIEAAGGKIVSGGQIDGDEWEITDWRTNARLAHGTNGLAGYEEAADRLDPDGLWMHIDQIAEQVAIEEVAPTDGIPPSLGEALQDWVSSSHTPVEEIAEVTGWDVAEVERCSPR